ncbi:MAG: hypothetical protein EXQ84_04795 [Rhodospirillaceae bacterium]|nr:hypothetical protein [Rhodospirillaceae bacterium]
MSAHFQKPRHKAIPLSLLAAGIAAMLVLTTAFAASPGASSAAESLRSAFRDAVRDASTGDDLDPAYELLGIAETAQQQDLPEIAAQAATAFADLVKRATTSALKTGGSSIEDTLDQFVDLRFMARTANLALPQVALDEAMASLFPPVSTSVQRKVDDAGSWSEKLKYADDLAGLQASATQIMKGDLARDMGAAFDLKTAQLETFANQEQDAGTRARMLAALGDTRKARDDRVVDANANNINVVATLMRNQGGQTADAGSRAPSARDVPEELAAGTYSCIETGFTAKQDPVQLRSLQTSCVNSGRQPVSGRCTTNNLAFLCYDAAPGGEMLTYVYRGTPEELYFQRKCSPDKVVQAGDVPPAGATFRAANAVLALTCAPAGAR